MARVLLVEDDEDVGRFVEVHLRTEGFDVARARDGVAALDSARALLPDLVLLDLNMPLMDGYAVCAALRDDPRTSATAIIIVTAKAQQDEKVHGLEAGADDYVTKPFDPAELTARIRAALRRSRRLRDVSPLTGMPGNNEIGRELDRLCTVGHPAFALLHVDLDNFKAYNDHYGFAMGDRVIKATAALLTDELERVGGAPCFAGHVGGDDFAVMLSAGLASPFAAAVVARFDAMIPWFYEEADRAAGCIEVPDRQGVGRRFPIMTISLGITTLPAGCLSSPAALASLASEMKSMAKREAGSSYRVDRRSS
ncbi:MAG TPA: response regulator [Acidimicrobiales bacterium]|nr:response regulator [Acidimicrobiales bacterium]